MGARGAGRTRDNSAGNRTRDDLISVAVHLFATSGVDGVSLAEINRAAGQKNNSAVTYHFGSKAGLIEAIFEHNTVRSGVRRAPLLERLENQGEPCLREVISAAVMPVADMVVHDDGGGDFVLMLACLLGSGDWPEYETAYHARWERWRVLVDRLAPAPSRDRAMARQQLFMTLVVHGIAGWERRRRAGLAVPAIDVVTEAIIDSATAMFAAPGSFSSGAGVPADLRSVPER